MTIRTAADDAVDRYLDRLDAALAGAPAARRDELLHEIIEHIVEARRELPDRDDEAAVLTLLDRLGRPEEIAAAELGADAGQASAPAPLPGDDRREKLAIVLLLFGGFFAGVGWLAGVVLLWLSPRWRDRDKLIGTLLIPGGLVMGVFVALLLLLGFVGGAVEDACATDVFLDCGDTGPSLAHSLPYLLVAIGLVLAPIASALHLLRRLQLTNRR